MTSGTDTLTRHVIVDTDTGIDDALALLYLAGRPEVEISAVTSVYGNTPVDAAVSNIARVLDIAGLPDVPVAVGAGGPIVGEPHFAGFVHGEDGLGDIWTDRPRPRALVAESAARMLVDMARERPGYYDLLPLGPLTNVGLALEIEPDLLTLFRSVVIMGGSGPFPAVGVAQMIDANVQNDPEAARRVFSAPRRDLVMVGVDVTAPTVVDEQAVLALRRSGSARGEFAALVLESYMDFYQNAWGRRVSPAHDGLVAAVLVQPELVTAQTSGPVNITNDGFVVRARLMRTAEGLPPAWPVVPVPDTRVVLDVDRPRFLADFLAAITADLAQPGAR